MLGLLSLETLPKVCGKTSLDVTTFHHKQPLIFFRTMLTRCLDRNKLVYCTKWLDAVAEYCEAVSLCKLSSSLVKNGPPSSVTSVPWTRNKHALMFPLRIRKKGFLKSGNLFILKINIFKCE